jgi:hypothetical protein
VDALGSQPDDTERLVGLAAFIPVMEASGFSFGTWDVGEGHLPWFFPSSEALQFVRAAYDLGWVVPGFNWNAWSETPEARRLLNEQDALASASIHDIERLLTVHIRADRLIEGHLDGIVESGYLLAVLKRAATLLRDMDE